MAIQLIKYQQIEVEKYDACIKTSAYQRVEAFSWYLDIVTNNKWDVLVYNDYEAVMPLPYNKKIGLKYIYTPMWVLQLGVFGVIKESIIQKFLDRVLQIYSLVDLRLNTENNLSISISDLKIKRTHFLEMRNYKELKNDFRSDRKKDLKRAIKNKLYLNYNDTLDSFLALYFHNLINRSSQITSKDCERFVNLINACFKNDRADLLTVYDVNNNFVSGGIFLKSNHTVTILVSVTDLNNRKNGANTFLIDQAIEHYKKDYEYFDFGGSSIHSIANYFLSLSATETTYFEISKNKLPLLINFTRKIKSYFK